MIGERVVLFRIENLEQGGGWIAAIIGAQLVDLVEHHHRIIYAGAADRLNHASRHRAHVRAPVAAQFGFVADAAEAQTL